MSLDFRWVDWTSVGGVALAAFFIGLFLFVMGLMTITSAAGYSAGFIPSKEEAKISGWLMTVGMTLAVIGLAWIIIFE